MKNSNKHSFLQGIADYFSGAMEEFRKISWPTKEQAAVLTSIVVVVSLTVSVLIGVLDLGLSELYKKAFDFFKA